MITIICPCGKEISTSPSRTGRKKYCSLKCKYKYAKRPSGLRYTLKVINPTWFGKGHLPWNTGRLNPYFDKSVGYWKICVDGKEMKYHRYLMENKIGRKLNQDEVVHHLDNNVNNNKINNLCLFKNKSEHLRYHWLTTRRK